MELLRLPMPTKDEVALVDNHPLSIQDFLNIRTQLQNPSNDTALWIGIAMLALEGKAFREGKGISSQSAYDIARYAIREISSSKATEGLTEYYGKMPSYPTPETVKIELEAITQKSTVQKSLMPLSSFN